MREFWAIFFLKNSTVRACLVAYLTRKGHAYANELRPQGTVAVSATDRIHADLAFARARAQRAAQSLVALQVQLQESDGYIYSSELLNQERAETRRWCVYVATLERQLEPQVHQRASFCC